MSSMTVRIRKGGAIALPAELCRRYGLQQGDVMALPDLGDGSFLLRPDPSQVARFGDQVAEIMAEEGVSLGDMLDALERERERYYRERYAEE
jgi:bifunctional DNA-binding transcriptional regulator/antitoxin component of YhaV-PrlF toxin-antitoxin module